MARRRRLLMPVQVYVDESGWKGQGSFMVMAGLIAESEAWATFATAWQHRLDASPRIAYFKAREAFTLAGEFYNWSKERRDLKAAELSALLNEFQPLAIFGAIELAGFETTLAPKCVKPLTQPYFWLFHVLTVASCRALLSIGQRSERFEIFFDQQEKFGPLSRRWYPLVLDLLEPAEREIMPIEPTFRSDREHLPLQAADLMAYLFRSAMESGEGAQFVEWMERVVPNIAVSDQTQVFRRGRLQAIADRMTTGQVTPDMLKRLRDVLGFYLASGTAISE
jgi:hypothetical protein